MGFDDANREWGSESELDFAVQSGLVICHNYYVRNNGILSEKDWIHDWQLITTL